MEKLKSLCTAGGNVKWCSHYREQYVRFSKKLKVELPYDPAILLLGIYSKELKERAQINICMPMFLAALFTIAKIGSKSNVHQWINEVLKCVLYTCNGILFSLKRKDILAHAIAWMKLENIMLSEIS